MTPNKKLHKDMMLRKDKTLRKMIEIIIKEGIPVDRETFLAKLGIKERQFARHRTKLFRWLLIFRTVRDEIAYKEKWIGVSDEAAAALHKVPNDPQSLSEIIDVILWAGKRGYLSNADQFVRNFVTGDTGGKLLKNLVSLRNHTSNQENHTSNQGINFIINFTEQLIKNEIIPSFIFSSKKPTNIFQPQTSFSDSKTDNGVLDSPEESPSSPGVWDFPDKNTSDAGISGSSEKIFCSTGFRNSVEKQIPSILSADFQNRFSGSTLSLRMPPTAAGESPSEKSISGFPAQPNTSAKNDSQSKRFILSSRKKKITPPDLDPTLSNFIQVDSLLPPDNFRGRKPKDVIAGQNHEAQKTLSRHELDAFINIQKANRNHHPLYCGLSPDQRTELFARRYVEILKAHYDMVYYERDIENEDHFFFHNKRFRYYQRARIRADIECADYDRYLLAQIEYYVKKNGRYDLKKHRHVSLFPTPQRMASPECACRYWEAALPQICIAEKHLCITTTELQQKVNSFQINGPDWGMNLDQIKYWQHVMRLIKKHADVQGVTIEKQFDDWMLCSRAVPIAFVKSPFCDTDIDIFGLDDYATPTSDPVMEKFVTDIKSHFEKIEKMEKRKFNARWRQNETRRKRAETLRRKEEQERILNSYMDDSAEYDPDELSRLTEINPVRIQEHIEALREEGKLIQCENPEMLQARAEHEEAIRFFYTAEQIAQNPSLLEPDLQRKIQPYKYRRAI